MGCALRLLAVRTGMTSPKSGMKMDTSKAKETAADIKDETIDFAKKLKQDIGTTWEEPLGFIKGPRAHPPVLRLALRMRSAKFTMALDSEDDTWWKKRLGPASAL